MAEKWAADETLTVKEALSSQISIIGENMNIRRFKQVVEENGVVVSYIHAGGRIGVLVDVETSVVNDAVKEMGKNIAMQIAALNPKYTSRDEVSAEFIEHEKSILMAQIQNDPKEASKPEKVIQGMIQGRINKEMKEICLLQKRTGQTSLLRALFVSRPVRVLRRKRRTLQRKLQSRWVTNANFAFSEPLKLTA